MYETPAPKALRAFMAEKNITGADLAALAGVSLRTARSWIKSADNKAARSIPWAAWTLILILTGKQSPETVFAQISAWKKEQMERNLYEREKGGQPPKTGAADEPDGVRPSPLPLKRKN